MNERIKQIRKEFNMNQEEFGKKIGVSRDTIFNLEAGRTEIKDIHIKSICKSFGVDYIWLTTGRNNMFVSNQNQIKFLTMDILNIMENIFENIYEQGIYSDEDIKSILLPLKDSLSNLKKLTERNLNDKVNKGLKKNSNAEHIEFQESIEKASKKVKHNCNTCEFNTGDVCMGYGKRTDNGKDTYGMEIKEAKKMFPKGCEDWGISLSVFKELEEK